MNRHHRQRSVAALRAIVIGLSAAMFACGGEAIESLDGGDSASNEASLVITPGLDFADMTDTSVARRFLIDEVAINLVEIRLLGEDPRIPAEGLPMLAEERVIRSDGSEQPALKLRLPDELIDHGELAVFVRIAPSHELSGASVVVKGRFNVDPTFGQFASTDATDPDVDPMHPGVRDPRVSCATDPDVDPMACDPFIQTLRGSRSASTFRNVMPFELRDDFIIDLVATLDGHRNLDVRVMVPAGRWLSETLVTRFEDAWSARPSGGFAPPLVLFPVGVGPAGLPDGSNGYRLDGE